MFVKTETAFDITKAVLYPFLRNAQSVFEFEFELDPTGLWLISSAFLIGNAKTDEADGMGMIFHAVHQLFGKGKDVVLGTKDVIDGDAARDLLEI